MNQDEMIFSADCTINFDDLGQFKNYSDDILMIIDNLKSVQNTNTQLKQNVLIQILKADVDDTFYDPNFKNLIQNILQIMVKDENIFKSRPNLYKLIFHNFMQVLDESFISYQFSQELNPLICKFLVDQANKNLLQSFQKMQLLLCLSKLSKKLSYFDSYENFADILCCFNQQVILLQDATNQWKQMMLNVYSEVIELCTRNRQLRQILSTKINLQSVETSNHLYLALKIQLWQRNSQNVSTYLKKFQESSLTNFQIFNAIVQKYIK